MNKKFLTLAVALGAAILFNACGDDKSSTAPDVTCVEGDCLEESSSSSDKADAKSSSSAKEDKKSSSSTKDDKSSSSVKGDEKSSSSAKDDEKSSSSANDESSSSVESSSSEAESSSSVEYEYLSTTPNVVDLEVSGDTLFAIFQRYVYDAATFSTTFNDNGLLAMYNVKTGDLLDTIQLATKNPMSITVVKGKVYVSTHGEYNANWGTDADENRGIELVDLKKKTSKVYVSGTKLGGGAYRTHMAVDKKNAKAYVAIDVSYGTVPVVEVDLSTGTVKNIDGILDGSGSLAFDDVNGLLYIGDRGFMDWKTYEMGGIMVYTYDGSKLTAVSDAEEDEEFRLPYSIATIAGTPYVFVSDYTSGALYLNYADSEDDGFSFDQDSKLAVVNGKLYLFECSGIGTLAQIKDDGSVAWQVATDNGNVYDVVDAGSGNLWVAMSGIPEIRLVSATDGSTVSAIDTKAFSAKQIKVEEPKE